MANYLTQDDVTNYGTDLVDFAQRAAVQAVAPHLQALDQQNHELRQRLAAEARHRLDQQVEAAIPNWRDLDQHPDWHQWLLGIDPLSGELRQNLLNQAKASGDAARCIAFFKSFFARPGSAAGGGASPTYSRTRSMPSGRIYTRAEIARLFEHHRRGAYNGREAEWARQEYDIIAAGREGRIKDPIDPTLSK